MVTSEWSARARMLAADAALAAVLLAVCLLAAPLSTLWSDAGEGPARPVDALGYALIVVATAPIAVRRLWPVPVLAVSAVATSTYLALSYPYGPIFGAVAIAVYTVGRQTRTRTALLLAAGTYLALLVHLFTNEAALPGGFGVIPAAGWVAIPLTIGIARRLVVAANARERAEAERRRIDEERLRLASEVHDIVGHGLAAIQMQADVALHVADRNPEQSQQALTAISSASAAALAELRATLAQVASHDADSRVPTPGLDRLDELCGRIRDVGVEVQLTVAGAHRRLPAETDVAAYRVVQESLTNVVKHAAAPRATVEVAYTEASVDLVIASPWDGHPIVEGFGIGGMRRRVEGVGGTLAVDTTDDAFEVRAMLPLAAVAD